jgi:hypothetical protein
MDELEILKKDWQKQENKFPKLSYNEIYKMILKKSSSIVKWIFIISLLEFILWSCLSFFMKDSESMVKFDSYGVDNIMNPITILGYIILAYFFYRFFMNYKTISATDNAKVLMENILKTRRSVKQYVGFNLIYLFILTFVVLGIEMNKDVKMVELVEKASANGELLKFYGSFVLITLVVLAIVIGLILVFYYLIYGLLLRRLNINYKELKKLEE